MKENQLKSLIKLLNDPDREVFEALKKQLSRLDNAEKILLDALKFEINLETRNKLYFLIREINFKKIFFNFKKWIKNEPDDLISPLIWLEKIKYPETDTNLIAEKIKIIKNLIQVDTNILTPLDKIKIINHLIYKVLRLKIIYGLSNPDDFLIGKVIEKGRSGLSLLNAFYTALAWKLNIPIAMIKGTNTFIPVYVDYKYKNAKQVNPKILFMINHYYKGAIVLKSDLDRIIKNENQNPQDVYEIVSNSEIINAVVKDLLTLSRSVWKDLFPYYQKIYNLLNEKNF